MCSLCDQEGLTLGLAVLGMVFTVPGQLANSKHRSGPSHPDPAPFPLSLRQSASLVGRVVTETTAVSRMKKLLLGCQPV